MVRVKGLEKEVVKVNRQTSATGKRIIRRERAREEKGGANTDQNLFNHLRRVRRVTNWCVFFKFIIYFGYFSFRLSGRPTIEIFTQSWSVLEFSI